MLEEREGKRRKSRKRRGKRERTELFFPFIAPIFPTKRSQTPIQIENSEYNCHHDHAIIITIMVAITKSV